MFRPNLNPVQQIVLFWSGPELHCQQASSSPAMRLSVLALRTLKISVTKCADQRGSNTAMNPAPAFNLKPLRGGACTVSAVPGIRRCAQETLARVSQTRTDGWPAAQTRSAQSRSSSWDRRSGTQRNQSPCESGPALTDWQQLMHDLYSSSCNVVASLVQQGSVETVWRRK